MRLSTVLASSSLVLASITAAAPAEIVKRAPEVVHLSTCQFFKTLPNGDNGAFIMHDNEYEYYANTNATQAGEMAETNDRIGSSPSNPPHPNHHTGTVNQRQISRFTTNLINRAQHGSDQGVKPSLLASCLNRR